MKKKTSKTVLGINVAQTKLEAVLLRRTGDEGRLEVLERFMRPRTGSDQKLSSSGDYSTSLPGLKTSDESDFTIEIGDAGGTGQGKSLSSSALGGEGADDQSGSVSHGATSDLRPFAKQLKDILNECSARGYPQPELAFCMGAPDVAYVELVLPASEGDGATPGKAREITSAQRKRLLGLLEKEHGSGFDRERVAFLPMTPSEGRARYLALVPATNDSVTTTVERLRGQGTTSLPPVRLLETEVSIYSALLRHEKKSGKESTPRHTALVRVGTEDTLLQVYSGKELLYSERLRSLTIYDAPETICSRVMLQQDEHKLEDFGRVLVQASGGRDERLLESFRDFYPEATVASLPRHLLGEPLGLVSSDEGPREKMPGSAAALGVALRLLDSSSGVSGVNLLPRKLSRRRPQLNAAWHTVVALIVLIGVSAFFTWRYMEGQEQIEAQREEMERDPIEMPEESPAVLEARVDSLEGVHYKYTHALDVLDSLLVGSDRWSRMLEKTSRATNEIGRIWFDGWHPERDGVRIEGHALTRSNVAHLARRLNAQIEKLEYAEVETDAGEVQTYPFAVVAPVPERMPDVAEYLQDVAAGHIQQSDAEWRPVNASVRDHDH